MQGIKIFLDCNVLNVGKKLEICLSLLTREASFLKGFKMRSKEQHHLEEEYLK